MTRWSIRQMMLPAFLVAAAVLATAASGDAQRKGRYKKDGDNCVWAAGDTGGDQCQPRNPGRFKKDGDKCVWDAKDVGDDQCRPATGRWKTEGSRCVWDGKDSGADQCNPRHPR